MLRRRGRIQVKLNAPERDALLSIIDTMSPTTQPVLTRAARAYEDPALQAEYERWVQPDIERGREADVAALRDSLAGGENTLPLTEAQALSWLRAFNHIRSAAGQALGVDADGWEERADTKTRERHEFRILMALAYLQEELIAALDS